LKNYAASGDQPEKPTAASKEGVLAAAGTLHHRFGLDGTDYEIDLSAAHAADLRAALARSSLPAGRFAARRPGRAARKPRTRRQIPGGQHARDQESWPPRSFTEADSSSPRYSRNRV